MNKWLKIIGVIIALLTALGGLWVGYIMYKQYYAAEEAKIESRYKSDRDNLLKPHNGDDLTSASAGDLMKDLAEVIDIKSQQNPEKRKNFRDEFAESLTKLFQNNSIDLVKAVIFN